MTSNSVASDCQTVADLIYQSAPSLFTLMFGPRQRAVACIAALAAHPHSRFSHRYIQMARNEQHIVGIAVLVPTYCLNDAADYHAAADSVFGPLQRLWLALLDRLLLRHLLRHRYPTGSFYIGNLAVAPEYRNRGIGCQLLSRCFTEVGKADLFISVDIDNPRAQKLYESLGFEVVETRAIRLVSLTAGSRVLRRSPHSGSASGSTP